LIDLQIYSSLHPMAPLGGLFVGVIGAFLILGARLPAIRTKLTYVGFAAGTLALFLGGRLASGLPAPGRVQILSLILAIVVEIALFITLIPRVRRYGERTVLVTTLAIVGVHFLIMLPAFGYLIVVLGSLCFVNAMIAWRKYTYSIGTAWFLDGGMKLAVGILLILTSPVFR
jgi:hypothetical protein